MKKIYLFFVSLFLSFFLSAQIPFDSLDINQVSVRVNANGFLGQDIDNQAPAFWVPKDSSRTVIFSSSYIVGGKKSSGGDILSFSPWWHTFNQDSVAVGPIGNNSNSKYNRVWKISKNQIDAHRSDWASSSYSMPEVIENWPANGDTSNGELFYMAPFVDWNNNQIYDPENGDWPCIKGDMAIYSVYNDAINTNPNDSPMNLEVHKMTYAYQGSGAIEYTVFEELRIANRSNTQYDSVYLGVFADHDVGCANDDNIGCDTVNNMFYGFNGDRHDEDCNGALGYGYYKVANGITFLNNEMTSFMSFQRGGGPLGDARYDSETYNYLKAYWRDTAKLHIGGTGYPGSLGSTNSLTNFMYPGDPRDTSTWSDQGSGQLGANHPPFDRRGIGSTGPFTLPSGGLIELSVAYVTSLVFDSAFHYLDIIDSIKHDVAEIRTFYNNQTGYCSYWLTGTEEVKDPSWTFNIFPNPSNDQVTIQFDNLNDLVNLEVFDSQGRRVLEQSGLKNQIQMDVSNWSEGLYIVRVGSGREYQTSRLLVE